MVQFNHSDKSTALCNVRRVDQGRQDQNKKMGVIPKRFGFTIPIRLCDVFCRVLSNDTVMIHANLSVALMLGQLVLVTSDGAAKYMVK